MTISQPTILTVRIDVGPIAAGEAPNEIAIDVYFPERLAAGAGLLFCIPGGGVTRRYFDLDGGEEADFSFARAMSAKGHVVMIVDPVGVGESTRPDDGFVLTAEVQSEAIHRAFVALRAMTIGGVALGALPAIGVGHSAGGMLALLQQASHRDFVAMMVFCIGMGGLPDLLPPAYRAVLDHPDNGRSQIDLFSRIMFGGQAYAQSPRREADTPAGRALAAVQDRVIAPIALRAMTPGSIAAELATISVPCFLAVGENDMTGPPHLLGQSYESCPDFTLYVVPGAGHHIFVTPCAPRLFKRALHWIDGLTSL